MRKAISVLFLVLCAFSLLFVDAGFDMELSKVPELSQPTSQVAVYQPSDPIPNNPEAAAGRTAFTVTNFQNFQYYHFVDGYHHMEMDFEDNRVNILCSYISLPQNHPMSLDILIESSEYQQFKSQSSLPLLL